MKKTIRFLCLILIVMMLLNTSTILVAAANSESQFLSEEQVKKKLDKLVKKYPAGSKWYGPFNGKYECYGFAHLIIYSIFGKYDNSSKIRAWNYAGSVVYGMTRIQKLKKCTVDEVKSMMSKAHPGDVLQFAPKNDNGHQHSMIIYSIDKKGVKLYECNYIRNTVTLEHVTWKELCKRQKIRGHLSLLRANNYCYTVNLDTNASDATIKTKNLHVILDGKAKLPAPKRVGYTFLGWFTEKENGKQVTKDTKIKKNLTLYAHYEQNTYQLFLDANEGMYSDGSITKTVSVKFDDFYMLTFAIRPPVRHGYVFKGWYTDPVEGMAIKDLDYVKTDSDQNLFAHWELNTPENVHASKVFLKKSIAVKWDKNENVEGYIVQCSTDKEFSKNTKTITVNTNSTVSTTIKSLNKGAYYIRVRSYKENDLSPWSSVLTVKV